MAVDTPGIKYKEMSENGSWDLIEALTGGTPKMRDGTTTFLPKEQAESQADYDVRLSRSFLTNGFEDAINKATARPFSKPVTITFEDEATETTLMPILEDMDGKGTNYQQYFKSMFEEMIRWGLSHSHTDYPSVDEQVEEEDGTKRARTSQDDITDGLRPVNRLIATPSLIGWKETAGNNGIPYISEVRIKEQVVEDVEGEEWEQEVIDQIRVLRANEYEIYQKKTDEKEYVKIGKSYPIDGKGRVNEIPIVTAYADANHGLYVASPPLFELAWKNLEHYQSSSDQRNGLRFARFNQIWVSGLAPEEIAAGLVFAPNRAGGSVNPDADAKVLEGSGIGLELGNKDLEHIEDQMQIMGWEIMTQRLANVKANPQMASEAKSRSRIEMWIDAMNRAAKQVIILNAKWMGVELTDEDFTFKIYQDFIYGMQQSQNVEQVFKARMNGDITRQLYIEELQRYGIITDEIDPEDEVKDVENESVSGIVDMVGNQDGANDVLVEPIAQRGGTTVADTL